MKKAMFAALVLLLLLLPIFALAQSAEDITADCTLKASENEKGLRRILDDDYTTAWQAKRKRNAYVEIRAPKGKAVSSLYVKWYLEPSPWRVAVPDGKGWLTVAESRTEYFADCLTLPESAERCRIYAAEGCSTRLFVAELRVFGEGELPADVQQWQPVPEKCDLLVITAHPDDELLFMGGTIPYYAGERGKSVELLNVVPTSAERHLELLDGLWLCGMRSYPIFGTMRDNFAMSLKVMYSKWKKAKLYGVVVGAIRRCKPDVIVTHDLEGEYGHGAHRATADAVTKALDMTDNPKQYAQSAKLYGTWQPQKVYIHLYDKNPVQMDWRVPLQAFGGKTAFDMAEAGFRLHISQQHTRYEVRDDGPYDNSLFGLFYSTVGPDVDKNDFFEHIPDAV